MKKKTRQRVYRPVSRKGKQTQRQYRDLKKQLCDATLRSKWKNRKSVKENISQFSLKDFENRFADDEQLNQRRLPRPLNERELVLMRELRKKHGDDLQAMVRDKKLNVYQWTPKQCEKLLQLYKQQHICSSAKKYLLPPALASPSAPADSAAAPTAAAPTAAAPTTAAPAAAAAAPAAAAAAAAVSVAAAGGGASQKGLPGKSRSRRAAAAAATA